MKELALEDPWKIRSRQLAHVVRVRMRARAVVTKDGLIFRH